MAARSEQLQIRVTPRQKAAIRRLARGAGQDVSAYVLSRVLNADQARFTGILATLRNDAARRLAIFGCGLPIPTPTCAAIG